MAGNAVEARAAVAREFEQPMSVENLDVLAPREGEVRVRLVGSGICHSDLHTLEGHGRAKPPVILGHEGAGIVDEVGPAVTAVAPGDHVMLVYANCGLCHFCVIGRPTLCESPPIGRRGMMPDGTSRFQLRDGLFASQFAGSSTFSNYTVVTERTCLKIRDDAPLAKVCLIGCGVMTGVGAASNTAKVQPGTSCLVIGCGGVGLSAVQGCVISGALRVIAVDIVDEKLELARKLGATHTINARTQNVDQRVNEITNGTGVEYAFEAISTVPTIRQAYDNVRAGGTCVVVGIAPPGSDLTIPVSSLMRQKTITGTIYGAARIRVDIPMLIDMYMAGKLKLDEMISRTIAIDEVNDAIEALRRGEVARCVIAY